MFQMIMVAIDTNHSHVNNILIELHSKQYFPPLKTVHTLGNKVVGTRFA